jgi:hypothetical protein
MVLWNSFALSGAFTFELLSLLLHPLSVRAIPTAIAHKDVLKCMLYPSFIGFLNLIRRKKAETIPAEFRDEDSALFISRMDVRKDRLFTSLLYLFFLNINLLISQLD